MVKKIGSEFLAGLGVLVFIGLISMGVLACSMPSTLFKLGDRRSTLDKEPPIILNIFGLDNGSIISGNFSISVLLTDESDIISVQLILLHTEIRFGVVLDFSLTNNGTEWYASLEGNTLTYPNGVYHADIKATDEYGNFIRIRYSVSVINSEDHDPPEILELNGIEDGGVYQGNMSIDALLTDASEITSVKLRLRSINGTTNDSCVYDFTLCQNETVWYAYLDIDLSAIPNGTYYATLSSTDEYNNLAISFFTIFIVTSPDNDAPEILELNGLENGGQYSGNMSIDAYLTDASEITSVKLRLRIINGTTNDSYVYDFTLCQNETVWYAYLDIDLSAIPNGTYYATLSSTDEYNNLAISFFTIFIVTSPDNDAPEILELNGLENGGQYSGNMVIDALLTDVSEIISVQLLLFGINGTTNGTYVYDFALSQNGTFWYAFLDIDLTVIPNGDYHATLTATDEYANAMMQFFSITIVGSPDQDPPEILELNGLEDGGIYSGNMVIDALLTDVSEINGVKLILLGINNTNVSLVYDFDLIQNSAIWYTDLNMDSTIVPDGQYIAIFVAYDEYGNSIIIQYSITITNCLL